MKRVDVTTSEGKILWDAYIELTQALADVVRDGPLNPDARGKPSDKALIVTIKYWPNRELSFQAKIDEEGAFSLWQLDPTEYF